MIAKEDNPNATHPNIISANVRPRKLPDSPDSIRARTPCHANATTLAILITAVANINPVHKYRNITIFIYSL